MEAISKLFLLAAKARTTGTMMSNDLLIRYKKLAVKMDTRYEKLISEALVYAFFDH